MVFNKGNQIDTIDCMKTRIRRMFLTNLGFSMSLLGIFSALLFVFNIRDFSSELATQNSPELVFQLAIYSCYFGIGALLVGAMVFWGIKIMSKGSPSSDRLDSLDWSILSILQLCFICIVAILVLSAH